MDLSGVLIEGSGSFEILELSTQDSVLKHLDVGTKVLSCTSAGTVASPSTQSYGSWEFDWYKELDNNTIQVFPLCPTVDLSTGRYSVTIFNNESIGVRRDTTNLNQTVSSYIQIGTWYRIKLTRTLDGEFTAYIKGGTFGNNDWTLISVSGGSGTNPVTDNTYTAPQYFVLDFDAGDRIGNIVMRKGVQQ